MQRPRARQTTAHNGGAQENVNLFRTKSQAMEAQAIQHRGALVDRGNGNNLRLPAQRGDPDLIKRSAKYAEQSSSSSGAVSSHTRSHDRADDSFPVDNVANDANKYLSEAAQARAFDIVVFSEEYAQDVNSYLFHLQNAYAIAPKHLSIFNVESKITSRHRAMLVDWIVHASRKCKYRIETIYIAINILDRFLQAQRVDRNRLQVYTVTAVWLAGKYEEVMLPDPEDLLYYCGNEFSLAEMVKAELEMLRAINFRLNAPVPSHFIRMYSHTTTDGDASYPLAKYLALTSQLEYNCAHVRASDIAAGAVWLSRSLIGCKDAWPKELTHLPGRLTEPDAAKIGRMILSIVVKVHTGKTTLNTVQVLFTDEVHGKVATSKALLLDNLKRFLH